MKLQNTRKRLMESIGHVHHWDNEAVNKCLDEIADFEELQEALAQKLETVRRSLTAEHDKIGEMIMAHGVIVNSTSVKAERLNAYRDGLRFALDLITRGGTK